MTASVAGPLAAGLSGDSVTGGTWTIPAFAPGANWSAAWWFRSEVRASPRSVPEGDIPAYDELAVEVFDEMLASSSGATIAKASYTYGVVSGGDYVDGLVRHIAVVVTGSTSATWYIDGVQVSTGSITAVSSLGLIDMTDQYSWQTVDLPGPVLDSGAGYVDPRTGSTTMQDVMVFTRALTAGEVFGIYQRGAGRLAESTSARAARLLDHNDWPAALRDLTASPYGTCDEFLSSGMTTVDALADVAATEQSRLFVSFDGKVTLQSRYHEWATTPGGTVQATLNPLGAGPGIRYATLVTDMSRRDVQDEITVSATGDTYATVSDVPAGVAPRSVQIDTLLPPTTESPVAANMATVLVGIRKTPVTRLSEPIVCTPDETTYAAALGLDIGDRVLLRVTPPGSGEILQHLAVERRRWEVQIGKWLLKLDLAPIPFTSGTTGGFLVLDSATHGLLGTNRLGY